MDAFEILVVILSVFLAVFLLLGIVFFTFLIKIARSVKRITDKAEDIVEDVEAASSFFKKSATSASFAGIVSNIVDKVSKSKKEK